MNLWAKRAGLLFSAAVLIFLLSCEDDSFLLGFRGKQKFQGEYHEIVFNGSRSSVLLLDSVYTDQFSLSENPVSAASFRLLIGQYDDPVFGRVRAEAFTQFQPNNNPSSPPYFNKKGEALVLDAITVDLLFDYYIYGSVQNINERVAVYRLTDSLTFFKRYITASTVPYSGTPLGELSFELERIVYDLKKDAGRDSSFYLRDTLATKNDPGNPAWAFAQELFAYAGSKGDSALVGRNLGEFRKQFYGLAFIPTSSTGIFGYNPMSTSSRLTLHYHTPTDTLALPFYFTPYPYVNANAFTNITTTRTGELAGLSTPNVPFNPSDDKRYIQDGSAVITELDLSDFYSFADTLDNIIINSAELSVSVIDPPPGINPPASLFALLMKEKNGKIVPLDMKVAEDSLTWRQFETNVYTELTSFAIPTELSNQTPLTLAYNKSSKQYSGYATLFFQKLFDNKDKPELSVKRIGLYPATAPIYRNIGRASTVPMLKTGIGNEVNRAVLNASGIKLKLYYTKTNP